MSAGGQRRVPLRMHYWWCVGEGLCPSRGRGNRRSAASGGGSEPVSRKCPDWRARQYPSVGWHDGGQENPAPTDSLVAGTVGRCGERAERCRWQRKRSERVAAVKILSVRRKAAQKFWAPQQDHRPLQRVIDGAVCGGTHGSRPTGRFCRAGPACPAGSAVQGRRAGFIECGLSS